MNTIQDIVNYQEIIKKSKFLTFLYPITSIENAKIIIETYKKEHHDATHVCYAYILDENTYKYYDDGEPTNSAGMPIYQALKNNKMIYTLCIVVRYFGGVKLGVGGLVHAYSSGALNALNIAKIIKYTKRNNYIIEIEYSQYDSLAYYLEKKGIAILDKQFLDNIFISISIDDETLIDLKNNFHNLNIILSI